MADYKEGEVAGVKWHRFDSIVVQNPHNGFPSVQCSEQEVLQLGSSEITRSTGALNFMFNPNEEFQLLDPETNEPTGETATGAQVHQLVHSLVLHEAMKRDARANLPLPPPPSIPPTEAPTEPPTEAPPEAPDGP